MRCWKRCCPIQIKERFAVHTVKIKNFSDLSEKAQAES